jgi:hypothetical protein
MSNTTMPVTLTEHETAAQSLACGTAGEALLAIERAFTGTTDWRTAQSLITQAAAGRVDAAEHAGLYYGAPAIAFVLHRTHADGRDRYATARTRLDEYVRRLTRRRLRNAVERVRTGVPASFVEYDLFSGLTGLGALLLHDQPGSDELPAVLRYLVRLTEPREHHGITVPGWWVSHHPDRLLPTPGGHANLGVAHGAAGFLALLANASLHGTQVDGQQEAIVRLCAWFDLWQQDAPSGPWWPQWLTLDHLRAGQPGPGPGRPSWCYGAAGIGRALQLAGLATGDQDYRTIGETAIAACLTDQQMDRLTEPGICHGLAGLYQTARRAAEDATGPAISHRLPGLAARLTTAAPAPSSAFLTGNTGVALVAEAIRTGRPPQTRWDACLLIT